nr:gametocyte-specific factor 1 homolog [Drosophila suzukii]
MVEDKAYYAVAGPNFEEYIVCPYDSVHRILPLRLTYHLVRCAKNHPSAKMVRCPFNTTHLYSVANMQKHVLECPNRSTLERYKLPDVLPPVEPRACEFTVESTEDWDAEPPVQTYNPMRYCERELIIRNPQGNPPAARREFRERERRRFLEKKF